MPLCMCISPSCGVRVRVTLAVFVTESLGPDAPGDPPEPPASPQPPTTPTVVVEPDPEPEDPATCPIVPGREVTIQIEKGKAGLGLSIVGGADTLLVSHAHIIADILLVNHHLFLCSTFLIAMPSPS